MAAKTSGTAIRANRIRMKMFSYGEADNHEHYAVSVIGDQVWEACEVEGILYRPCSFDEIPECNWDRTTKLEEQINA